jgi:hypothetical protein
MTLMKPALGLIRTTLLMFCASTSLRAAAPTEFLEIPWGASPGEAKRIMMQRQGVSLKKEASTALQFAGGTFADYPADRYELDFPEAKFARGTVFVTIPAGNAKDGAPLRNHQFEAFFKTLSEKYGHGVRTGDGKHTEANWSWTITDARTGQKRSVSVRLSYSWEPYEFLVTYANLPFVQAAPQPVSKPPKKKDL